MRTAVITDLHANREAVEAVLDHALAHGAQRWVLLGDFVGYGADPAWVVDLVLEHVARGAITLNGQRLKDGDGARLRQEGVIELSQGEQAEVLLFDLRPNELPGV